MESLADQELVSIIVPVYNVEEYIEQCISSILKQTYSNIELILVDDGSTDGSGRICDRYARLDRRIKLIHQPNLGVVTARKRGAALATGSYIGFVDGDDYIEENLYQRLMECRENFDMVISRWFREDGGNTRIAYDKISLGAYRTQEDMDFLLDHLINVSIPGGTLQIRSGFMTYMWNKIYRASIVREVLKDVDATISFGEDIDFTYRIFLKCNAVLLTDICGYHYRIRRQSASHSSDMDCSYLKNVCKIYESLFPVFQAHPRQHNLLPQLQFKISTMLAKAPAKMGFPIETRNNYYVFPFLNLLAHKRIALYGAGRIGRSYLWQINRCQTCEAVLVDRDWREYQRVGDDVASEQSLLYGDYDYIILTALDEDGAAKQERELMCLGVDASKILWKKPFALD